MRKMPSVSAELDKNVRGIQCESIYTLEQISCRCTKSSSPSIGRIRKVSRSTAVGTEWPRPVQVFWSRVRSLFGRLPVRARCRSERRRLVARLGWKECWTVLALALHHVQLCFDRLYLWQRAKVKPYYSLNDRFWHDTRQGSCINWFASNYIVEWSKSWCYSNTNLWMKMLIQPKVSDNFFMEFWPKKHLDKPNTCFINLINVK